MTLPPRKSKPEKRASRWKSQAHLTWLRKSFCCANCGSDVNVQAAHVRMGSGAGMGQKPDDWRAVPLCSECHNGDQHTKLGEPDFWARYLAEKGQSVHQLIDALCKASPKSREIREARNAS